MENEINTNQESDSTYHYGRNESPFGREDISGRVETESNNSFQTYSSNFQSRTSQNVEPQSRTQSVFEQSGGNPYSQGSVYGQGIYTGNDFVSQEPQTKPKRKKEKKASNGKGKKVGALIASAVAFGLIAGGVMVGVNTIGNKMLGDDVKTAEIATVTTSDSVRRVSESGSIADIAEEVMPSIVSITNTSVQTVRSWFQSYEQEVSGSGSGIIIGQTDDEIMIATNNHVIEGAKELTVAFCDQTAVEATVKGADSYSDLAVLIVKTEDMDQETLSKIKIAALGSSDNLRVGDSVIAIGNALGYGQSLTGGYVSALNREVDVDERTMNLLQTDAAINPGNSGGALLNLNGEVVGINTVKFVDSTVEGMGYAIPISTAIPIINDLMNQEVIAESEQGYLGIRGEPVTDEYTQRFDMPKGVYVVKIVEGSPADKCGLKAGDVITKFAGRDIADMENLQNILSGKKAGEEVEMVVQRNNEKGEYEEVTLTVTLGAKKDMPSDDNTDKSTQESTEGEYYVPDDFFDGFNGFWFNN